MPVVAATQVVQRREAGDTDRLVGLPGAPGPAHRVGDDHGDVDAGQLEQPGPQRPGRGVRVDRQQQHGARLGAGGVDPRGGEHQPVPGLDDAGAAAPGDHPHGLGGDRLLAVDPHGPALGLRHDLRGHHHDVPVGEREVLGGEGGDEQCRQVVTGGDLRHPVRGPDEHRPAHPRAARSSAASASADRAIAVADGTSGISSGTARQAMPAASTASTAEASLLSTSHPSSSPPSLRAP